jgi:pimeloyl-ACP methyl ester carboxylesterase
MQQGTVEANGITFTYLEEGQGPLALLLHGFPDNALTWDRVTPALAGAGYRVVAPFMRGYPPTGIPADGRYGPGVLGDDVAALIEALGGGPAFVLGHDWGAIATYSAAARHPDAIRRAIVMAGAHPASTIGIFNMPPLLHGAFHVWLFQLQGFAEQALTANDFALVDYLWDLWSPGHGDLEHVKRVKETLRAPGAVDAALAYYRSLIRTPLEDPEFTERSFEPTKTPVLSIHGSNDGLAALADGEEQHFAGEYRHELVEGAGHFVQREQPERVAELAIEWFGA